MPKRKCASITSSALFASVALSTVILRPIDQVGCRSASASVAPPIAPRVQCGTGRRDAVMMRRRTSLSGRPAEALEDRGVLAVDRDDLAATAAGAADGELAGDDE